MRRGRREATVKWTVAILFGLLSNAVHAAALPPEIASNFGRESRLIRLSPENDARVQAYFDDIVDRARFGAEQSGLSPRHVIVDAPAPLAAMVVDRQFGVIYWNARYLLETQYVDTDLFVAAHELTHFTLLNRGLRSRRAREYHADVAAIRHNLLRWGTDEPALVHPATLIDFLRRRPVHSEHYADGRALATLVQLTIANDRARRLIPTAPTPRLGMNAVLAELRSLVLSPATPVAEAEDSPTSTKIATVRARVTGEDLEALLRLDRRRRRLGAYASREGFELDVEYLATLRGLISRIASDAGTKRLARLFEAAALMPPHFFEFWSQHLDDNGERLRAVEAGADVSRAFAGRFDLPIDLVGEDARMAEDVAANFLLLTPLDLDAPVVTLGFARLVGAVPRNSPSFGDRPLAASILLAYDAVAHDLLAGKSKSLRAFRQDFRARAPKSLGADIAAALEKLETEHPENAVLRANLARLRTPGLAKPAAPAAALRPAGFAMPRFKVGARKLRALVDDAHLWRAVLADLPDPHVLGAVAWLRGDDELPAELARELEIRARQAGILAGGTEVARALQHWVADLSATERAALLGLVIDDAKGRRAADPQFRRALFRTILKGLPDASARAAFVRRWEQQLANTPAWLHQTMLATALAETAPRQSLRGPAFVSRLEAWELLAAEWGDLRARGYRIRKVVSATPEHAWIQLVDLKSGETHVRHVARRTTSPIATFAAVLNDPPPASRTRFGIFGLAYRSITEWWTAYVSGLRRLEDAFAPYQAESCEGLMDPNAAKRG